MKIDRRSGSAPLISVVLPTSNASLHLLPTLASLDQQDQDLFEVIAIDNQSTDGTTSVLAAYVNAGQHHRCMLSAMDMGVADAFNKGISLARGSYLYFICAGDKLRAAVLRKLAPHLDGETDLVYGDIHLLACGRDAHYDNVTPLYMASRSVCHQAMFYHRSIFNRFGGYNPRYKSFSDYELNLRCLFAPRIRAQHIDLIVADYLGNGPSDFGDLSFEADREELITRHLGSDTLEAYRRTIEGNNVVLARLEELAIIHRAKWAIYGAGALGREIVLNRRIGKILLEKLVGFLDTDAQRQGSLFLGYPVMQPTEYLLTHSIDLVLVAIGSEAGREAAKLTLATTGFNLSHTIDWR